MKMRRRFRHLAQRAAGALLVFFVALATARAAGLQAPAAPGSTFKLTLSDEGVLLVNDVRVKLPDLPKKLKSLGVKPDTVLVIAVPQDASTSTLTTISKELATKGYKRFTFIRPRKAVAFVGTNTVAR